MFRTKLILKLQTQPTLLPQSKDIQVWQLQLTWGNKIQDNMELLLKQLKADTQELLFLNMDKFQSNQSHILNQWDLPEQPVL